MSIHESEKMTLATNISAGIAARKSKGKSSGGA
jgi:hypothetical protein